MIKRIINLNNLALNDQNQFLGIWRLFKEHTFYLKGVIPRFLFRVNFDLYSIEISISRRYVKYFFYFFRNHLCLQYKNLVDIIVVDNPGKENRFVLVYLLQSIKYAVQLRIRLVTNEINSIFSLSKDYFCAYWLEREVWDLFGIAFLEHSDLRRLLTDYGFSGFPLRKDYPLSGYYEQIYRDSKKRLCKVPVSLAQAPRYFFYQNPWKKI